MVSINGKKYKINLDIKWGTQKMMRQIEKTPDDPKNEDYMESILKDILVPQPTQKQILNFRRSDIEKAFNEFASEMKNLDTDFKKKLT